MPGRRLVAARSRMITACIHSRLVRGAPLTSTRRAFETLDGLRGVGAVVIVLMHLRNGLTNAYAPAGAYLAVDLFFGLSGFVLANAYGGRFEAGLGVVGFMRKRLFRLWPLYAAGILITGLPHVIHSLHHGGFAGSILPTLAQLCYVPWPDNTGHLYPLNIPAWSLLFELTANVLLVLSWRWLSVSVLVAVIAASACVLTAGAAQHGSMDVGSRSAEALIASARVICSFALGILVWRLRPSRTLGRAWAAVGLVGVALALPSGPAPRWALDVFLTVMVFPLILWLAAGSEPKVGLPFFKAGGAMSYALYAVHVPILSLFLQPFLAWRPSSWPVWVVETAVVAVLMGIAWILNAIDISVRSSARSDAQHPRNSTVSHLSG